MAERQSIQEFMEEIEREKTNIFMEVYRGISANFSRIFSYISPGGSGELTLENPDAPFLGGIDIRAKPRGKAVRNTRVMSGGEKSITALALIFAIQDYRPAPFYILDEVDASLDDVNSDRVAALIHSLAKNNQFIIVSLRDITIAKAERLIGVVSQLGRSRILSVQMTTGGELEFATSEEP
ncbi:MAG: chromosome segregation protein SMC, partial [Candidatus Heimdallarchaeota archaeon]|nr:chromosome segregation protein SMC [Candidatus Heimdallarchaeota archaeon]